MKAMSEVLAIIIGHAETNSSILVGLDRAHALGDITMIEHGCANRIISKWLRANDNLPYETFQVKRQAFNQLIKETKANESFRVR